MDGGGGEGFGGEDQDQAVIILNWETTMKPEKQEPWLNDTATLSNSVHVSRKNMNAVDHYTNATEKNAVEVVAT